MYYAQITNGVVTAVSELAGEVNAPNMIQIDGLDPALLGKAYEAGEFVDVAVPEDPRLWWIDVGPFKDRLGMDALAIAASDDGVCKAVQAMLEGRLRVELQGAKVASLLGLLVAHNQPTADARFPGSGPMTPAKITTITTTPTTEEERHIKGLVTA